MRDVDILALCCMRGGVLEEGKIKDVGVVGLYGTRKIEWRWGRCE